MRRLGEDITDFPYIQSDPPGLGPTLIAKLEGLSVCLYILVLFVEANVSKSPYRSLQENVLKTQKILKKVLLSTTN